MNVLDKISTWVNRIVMGVVLAFLAVMLAASTVQVVSRYVFNSSIVWTEELARYCFIWLNMLGVSVLVKNGGHAVVDLFSKKLKGSAKKVYQAVIRLAMLYIGVIFVRFGYQLVTVVAKQKSPAMHISMGLVYSSVMVCGVLVCLHMINALVQLLAGKGEEEKS